MDERSSSLDLRDQMSVKSRDAITEHKKKRDSSMRAYEAFLKLATHDKPESLLPEFIKTKEAYVESQIDLHNAELSGIADSPVLDKVVAEHRRKEVLELLKPLTHEYVILRKSKRGFVEDLKSEMTVEKRRKTLDDVHRADAELFESAYTELMSVSFDTFGRPSVPPEKFKQDKFKTAVLDYYGAKVVASDNYPDYYCHLAGPWGESTRIKAAHIVPKSISIRSAEYLFGSDEQQSRSSPRNALLLYPTIKEALDAGKIAIVPIPTAPDLPTRWNCTIIDPGIKGKMIYQTFDEASRRPVRMLKFDQINNKELVFQNDRRPAKRYLYFRFIMAVLKARKREKEILPRLLKEEKIDDHVKTFWASPGEYVKKSTLVSFTRKISGLELPQHWLDETTFEDDRDDPVAAMQVTVEVAEELDRCDLGDDTNEIEEYRRLHRE